MNDTDSRSLTEKVKDVDLWVCVSNVEINSAVGRLSQ